MAAIFMLALAVLAPSASAQTARNVSIELTATTSSASPYVTLKWPSAGSYSLNLCVRPKGSSNWGTGISLPIGTTSYADTNALPGVAYEYSLIAGSPYTSYGAIVAGSDIPLVDQRGNVMLLVDNTMTVPLANEITQLQQDLAADGWVVYRHDVPRQATTANSTNSADYGPRLAELQAVRTIVQNDYNNNGGGNNWSLFFLGHVPVPYSGVIAPDGHGTHWGAWPTDLYYADVDGGWTDTSASASSGTDQRNWNVAGDGKFDQDNAPSTIELQCGRVDLANMSHVPTGMSETELLRQYLVRDHRFRCKTAPYDKVARRGIVDDNFGYFGGEAFASSGWRTGFSWFGNAAGQMDALDWFTTLQTNPMLLAYGCGAGYLTACTGVGYSIYDFGSKDSKAVFNMLFGSWFGDWDSPDNCLRAPLAGTANSLGLVNVWSGRGYFYLFHMALGDTVGYCVRFTQNHDYVAGGWNGSWGAGAIQMNLMGDPTLRLHSVAPPTKVTATSSAGGIALSWLASSEAGLSGYHVYRSTVASGPFTRLTGIVPNGSNPTGSCLSSSTLTYMDTDASLLAGTNYTYLVKAVKMETSASGIYANQSLGAAVTLTHLAAVPSPTAPTRLAVSRTAAATCVLTWDDNASDETGYLVERCDPVTGIWSQIASLPANSTNHTDYAAAIGQIINYRVRATGAGANSAYSTAAADYNRPGIFCESAYYYTTTKGVGAFNAQPLRFSGSAGIVGINYTTTDVLSTVGTDYTAVAGSVTWNHGEGGAKAASVPIVNLSGTQPTKIFKISYSGPTNSLALGTPTNSYVFITDPAALALSGTWATTTMGALSADTGYAEIANGIYGVATRGTDYGVGASPGTADTARYLYTNITGDFRLTARASYFSSTGPNVRAGIMVRGSLASNSMMNALIISGNTLSCARYSRASNGAGSITGSPLVYAPKIPNWLRVTRLGNQFISEQSANGIAWTAAATSITQASFPSSAYVGFSISTDPTDGDVGSLGYARFDNVSLLTGSIPVSDPGSVFSSGFEYSAYSGSGTRLNFTDPNSGSDWTTVVNSGSLGASIDAYSSQANPAGGSGNHIRLIDAATNTIGTYLNTGATTTGSSNQSLRVAFKYAVTTSTGNSGNGLTFGDGPVSPYGFGNDWVAIRSGRDSGSLTYPYRAIFINYDTAPGVSKTEAQAYKADGTYYNFVPGSYVNIVFKINPVTFQYQSIKVDGVEQLGMTVSNGLRAGIPAVAYVPMTSTTNAPLSYFHLYSSSSATNTYDVDDVIFGLMTPWQQWQADNFGMNWNNAAMAGPGVIAVGDGLPNLLKYALGLPVATPATNSITLTKTGLTCVFTYRRPASRPDINYAVEVAPDFSAGSWTTNGVTHVRTVAGDPETWQASYPAGASCLFFRLRVAQP